MNNDFLVSVIIPTYNHGQYIGRCIQSLVDQAYQNWEAIIINNYSEDNTIDVVNSFKDKRIRLINFRNNGIIAVSRNEGIRNAKGEYLAFLDSDDWWYKNKLSLSVEKLKGNDLVFHNLDIVRKNGKVPFRKIRGRKLHKPVFLDLLLNENAIANSSVVLRKSLISKVGLLDEDFNIRGLEDFDFWLRISRVSEKFCFIPKVLGCYWQGNTNYSSASQNLIEKHMYLYNRYQPLLDREYLKEFELLKSYIQGRIKFRMSEYKDSIGLLRCSLKKNNLGIKLRSLFLLIICYWRLIRRD